MRSDAELSMEPLEGTGVAINVTGDSSTFLSEQHEKWKHLEHHGSHEDLVRHAQVIVSGIIWTNM